MRIAAAQYETKTGDLEFNLSQLERGLAACEGKADLIVFGESFLQGFCSVTFDFEKDRHVAVPRGGETFARIAALTENHGAALCFGYFELDGESIYSSCALIDGGRLTANYRRISAGWKEPQADSRYREGVLSPEFMFRGQAVKLALCGDLWDCPEHFHTGGVLIWPCYLNFPPDEWREAEAEYALQAALCAGRAVLVNPLSREPESVGGAFLFERGRIEARLEYGKEGVLFMDI